jgi:hypothetical protein
MPPDPQQRKDVLDRKFQCLRCLYVAKRRDEVESHQLSEKCRKDQNELDLDYMETNDYPDDIAEVCPLKLWYENRKKAGGQKGAGRPRTFYTDAHMEATWEKDDAPIRASGRPVTAEARRDRLKERKAKAKAAAKSSLQATGDQQPAVSARTAGPAQPRHTIVTAAPGGVNVPPIRRNNKRRLTFLPVSTPAPVAGGSGAKTAVKAASASGSITIDVKKKDFLLSGSNFDFQGVQPYGGRTLREPRAPPRVALFPSTTSQALPTASVSAASVVNTSASTSAATYPAAAANLPGTITSAAKPVELRSPSKRVTILTDIKAAIPIYSAPTPTSPECYLGGVEAYNMLRVSLNPSLLFVVRVHICCWPLRN